MAKKGQLTAAWEMLSAVVMLRAKAKEHKLGRLLSSLHGVEVELARVIAAGDEAGVGDSLASATPGGAEGMLEGAAVGTSRQGAGAGPRRPDSAEARSVKSLQPRRRQDAQLEAYSRKYLELAGQLKDMMVRGEVAACGLHAAYDTDGPGTQSDDILTEQHQLSLVIARLKASSFGGLAKKAAVLDDLAEEASDDPVQALARSLARDVMALHQESKVAL